MPYPNLNDTLAIVKHYYICHKNENTDKLLFKCQTFKLTMLNSGGLAEFNEKFFRISSNNKLTPFTRDTVVDKRKLFELLKVKIPLQYLCNETPKCITERLYADLLNSFREIEFKKISIDKVEFVRLNPDCE